MKHDRASLVKAVLRFAGRVEGPVRLLEFCRVERVSIAAVYREFPEGVYELLCAAGIGERVARIGRLDEGTLMVEVERVARGLGRAPTRKEMMELGRVSISTYQNLIGKWGTVVRRFEKWRAGRRMEEGRVADRMGAEATGNGQEATVKGHGPAEGPRGTGNEDGTQVRGLPLGFRGLMHAPINELGVVHLFGVLAPEVGMAVEHIGSAFPDCRGLRRGPDGKWRKVAVEFELRSSNFRAHAHDAARCDVIVCWEHDWKDCPVEVIPLRGVMEKAMGQGG